MADGVSAFAARVLVDLPPVEARSVCPDSVWGARYQTLFILGLPLSSFEQLSTIIILGQGKKKKTDSNTSRHSNSTTSNAKNFEEIDGRHARCLELVLLLHDSSHFMERFVLVLVLPDDHLPVVVPLLGHVSESEKRERQPGLLNKFLRGLDASRAASGRTVINYPCRPLDCSNETAGNANNTF